MHIVVVGGGFAGVKAALELSKRHVGRITLISDETYFLHHATLYATATGRSIEGSVIPLSDIFKNNAKVEVVRDKIVDLDSKRKFVSSKRAKYPYDVLILALGSVTTYFGIKGLRRHAYGIKTLADIKEFTHHIQEQVAKKKIDKEYFVIGGGPSGVELAGALHENIRYLCDVHDIRKANVKVSLVEGAPRILPSLSYTASNKVRRRLKKIGVLVLENQRVEELDDDIITINDKQFDTKTAIWTSGVANNPFFEKHSDVFKIGGRGKVSVDKYLRASKDIFVLGDNNNVKYSGMAWPAMHQAQYVAKYLAKKRARQHVKPFKPRSVPAGIPVGENWGYVEWKGLYVSGRTGYFVRRMMELYGYAKLVPLRQAIRAWRAHNVPQADAD